MKAVILCGGQGTRIRDVNESLPKRMLPIGGKPMVWRIMKGYATYGIKNFVLCLGYKGWLIKEFFLNYRAMTADVTVHLDRIALRESWGLKRSLHHSVSNDTIEQIHETGRSAGALGGSFVLFVVPPDRRDRVRDD